MKNTIKGTGQRRGARFRRARMEPARRSRPEVELLESRRLLSLTGAAGTAIPAPIWMPTDTNLFDAQYGPMANLGVDAVSIYRSYVEAGGGASVVGPRVAGGSTLAARFPKVEFEDGLVGMQVKSLGGDFDAFVAGLRGLDMQVEASSATFGAVDGYLPVAELPALARLPRVMSGEPMDKPVAGAAEYQGASYNESETAMAADAARDQYGLTGAGVKIGVLSTSVNQVGGGLAASYASGDLDPNDPVQVIQDGPPGDTDEGRAMLESIHDIAPAAQLAFANADQTAIGFANNILALAEAGCKILVDDIYYNDDPMFQDGFIAQAIDTVTAMGVSYFGFGENNGPDAGYLSTFRAASGTIPGVGSGTFMNFDPNTGSPTLKLPITTTSPDAELDFEYDQPYAAQEPAVSPGRVTSDVAIEVLNSSGQVVVGAAQNQDNVAAQEPLQIVYVPQPGHYEVAFRLVSGPALGHVEVVGGDNLDAVTISQQFGTAGGTSYPSTYGHSVAAASIGVGATPWWAPAPYLDQQPLANEPFSSTGPALTVFTPQGIPLATPQVVQNPTITAPDGGTTSFFEPGAIIDTSQSPPYVPGEPTTPTDLVPADQQGLPSFFGTSQAAPDAAAVAALMLQVDPALTPAQVRAVLIASALPMNGTPKGTWNAQSGYGLVDAVAAVSALEPSAPATTTAVTSTATSPSYGRSVTLKATVKGASKDSSPPTGLVDFVDTATGDDLGTATLDHGVATLTFKLPSRASNLFLVTYEGGTSFAPSTGYLTLEASGHPTTTTLTIASNPSSFDQAVPLTVTVQGRGSAPAVPTGFVDLFEASAGIDLGTYPLSGGTVTIDYALPLGSSTIVATYDGNAEFDPSNDSAQASVQDSILVLDPSADGALTISGGAKITMPGLVIVDSSAGDALTASGAAQVSARAIGVVGGVKATGSSRLRPAPITGYPYQPDVLANEAIEPSPTAFLGSVNLGGNSTLTISQGEYSSISVSGSAHLLLNPGLYVITGGGLSISGAATVSINPDGPIDPVAGSGVLIDNSGSEYPSPGGTFGPITVGGSGSLKLSPVYNFYGFGIALFQPPDNAEPITISGTGVIDLGGGAIYAPAAPLSVTGSGQIEHSALVVDQLQLGGSGSVTGQAPSAQPATAAPGGPAATLPAIVGLPVSNALIPSPTTQATTPARDPERPVASASRENAPLVGVRTPTARTRIATAPLPLAWDHFPSN